PIASVKRPVVIHPAPHPRVHEASQVLQLLVVAILDRDIPPLAPAQLTQPLHKGAGPLALCCSRARAKEPDGRQLRLLRPRHHRPCCRAAEQRDEVAALHSVTSSARGRRLGGTSRPSARAVGRLMTSSNLLDCMTGKSAGLAPLRMRPT